MEHNWPIVQLTSIDSTNNYAAKLIETRQVVNELVINARFQRQGRGQGNNRWDSDPSQNLTFTLVLKPNYLNGQSLFCLNQTISLGLIDFLFENQILARIKWPNDILVGCKKIAGILIENIFSGNTIDFAIIGIGVNVNQEYFPTLEDKAISIKNLIGKDINLDFILHQLLNCIHQRLKFLKRGELELIQSEYKKHMYLFNHWGKFIANDKTFRAKIIDVKPTGELCMLDEEGITRTFVHKEVVFL